MYKIGPYCFDLQGFYRNDICESWLWKLDAFRVHASISLSADMRIEYNPKKKIDYNGKSMESHLSGFYEIRNYLNDGYWIWDLIRKRSEQMILQFAVNDRFSEITLTHDMSNSDGNAAFEALSDIIFPCMLTSEILTFHGVLMEYDGYGIILSAASGVGKTTHARLWRDHKNALIINGDRASCFKDKGYWKGFGTPWCGSSGEYVNRSVPIRNLVILERGKENKAEILKSGEALAEIWNHVLYPRWNYQLVDTAIELLNSFLKEVKILKLICRPDYDAVDTLLECIEVNNV